MQNVFLRVLNFGITAGYIVLAVLLLRLLFKKAPKWVHCLLWLVVGLRLLLPFSFESAVSLVPSAAPIPADIAVAAEPQVESGISAVDRVVNPVLSEIASDRESEAKTPVDVSETAETAPARAASPLARTVALAAVIWLVGVVLMLGYGLVSYLRLRRRVAASLHLKDRIYLCDHLDTSFILGVFRPRIYLQSELSEEETRYVIEHEQAHIARRDHWWKPLGFLLLAVYWFQPLLWLAYVLLCRDIEGACDEKVIAGMDAANKKGYAETLVSCGTHRRSVMACPLAFGETAVKDRIKAVLNYRKPAFWIVIVAVLACVAAAVVFLTVPKKPPEGEDPPVEDHNGELDAASEAALREKYPEYFGLDTSEGLTVYVWQMSQYSYSFHPTATSAQEEEPKDLRSVTAAEMRIILSTYDLPQEKIEIVFFKHPLSSYIGFEDPEDRLARIKYLLFGKLYDDDFPKHNILTFDIDGDGTMEVCSLGYGKAESSAFSITVRDTGANANKYYGVFEPEPYDAVGFCYKMREDTFCIRIVKGGETPETQFYDIEIADGAIVLTASDYEEPVVYYYQATE